MEVDLKSLGSKSEKKSWAAGSVERWMMGVPAEERERMWHLSWLFCEGGWHLRHTHNTTLWQSFPDSLTKEKELGGGLAQSTHNSTPPKSLIFWWENSNVLTNTFVFQINIRQKLPSCSEEPPQPSTYTCNYLLNLFMLVASCPSLSTLMGPDLFFLLNLWRFGLRLWYTGLI